MKKAGSSWLMAPRGQLVLCLQICNHIVVANETMSKEASELAEPQPQSLPLQNDWSAAMGGYSLFKIDRVGQQGGRIALL